MPTIHTQLRSLALFTAVLSVACGGGESVYVGRWECTAGGNRFVEIRQNNDALLWIDNEGTYSASMDDSGVLVVEAPLLGTLSIPIDESTGELLCPGVCECDRFTRVPTGSASLGESKDP